jgi:hypothetical protein
MLKTEIAGEINVRLKRLELATQYFVPVAKRRGNMIVQELWVYVLPKDIRTKLKSFDQRFMARQQLTIKSQENIQETWSENMKVESVSGYLAESKWGQFQEELKQWEAEYFKLRDEILESYEEYVAQFIKGFLAAMVKPEYRRQVEFELKCTIPSREEYGKSFEVEWEKR